MSPINFLLSFLERKRLLSNIKFDNYIKLPEVKLTKDWSPQWLLPLEFLTLRVDHTESSTECKIRFSVFLSWAWVLGVFGLLGSTLINFESLYSSTCFCTNWSQFLYFGEQQLALLAHFFYRSKISCYYFHLFSFFCVVTFKLLTWWTKNQK